MNPNGWQGAVAAIRVTRCAAAAFLALAAAGSLAAQTPSREPNALAEPAKTVGGAASQHTVRSGIDGRLQLLAKELDLDSRQQDEVRRILLQQRSDVNQVWNDPSLPSATRIAATRAIGDKTAERIRAVLDDAQREKYSKPRPPGVAAGGTSADLATWIDKANGR